MCSSYGTALQDRAIVTHYRWDGLIRITPPSPIMTVNAFIQRRRWVVRLGDPYVQDSNIVWEMDGCTGFGLLIGGWLCTANDIR